MNSERIYQADIIDEEGDIIRKLVYKEESSSGVVEYRDMEASLSDLLLISEFFYFSNDQIVNSVPLSKIVELDKRVSRKTALKLYYEDLRKLLNVKDLYIGDIGIVTVEQIQCRPNICLALHNRLLLQCGQQFLDLDDYNKYDSLQVKSLPSTNIKDVGIINELPFVSAFQGEIEHLELPKQKILEMYYERYQEMRYL